MNLRKRMSKTEIVNQEEKYKGKRGEKELIGNKQTDRQTDRQT